VQIFFLALFEEKLNKLLDQQTLAGYPVSGLTGYPAGQFGIPPDIGYQKGRIIRSDIRCISTKLIFAVILHNCGNTREKRYTFRIQILPVHLQIWTKSNTIPSTETSTQQFFQ
jgi:hypothetical protein